MKRPVVLWMTIFALAGAFLYIGLFPRTETAQGLHLRVQGLIGHGKFSQAEALSRKALALDDQFAKSYIDLGNIYSFRGDYVLAEKAYLTALECIGADRVDQAVTHYNLGGIYKREGNGRQAWMHFLMAYEMRSEYYVIKNDPEGFVHQVETDMNLPAEIFHRLQTLKTALNKGRYQEVLADSNQFLKDNPGSRYTVLFLKHRIRALSSLERYEEAIQRLESFRRSDPSGVHKAWIDRMMDLVELSARERFCRIREDLPGQILALERLKEKFPSESFTRGIRLQLAELYLKAGDYSRASQELRGSGLLRARVIRFCLFVGIASTLLMAGLTFIFRVLFRGRYLQQRGSPIFKGSHLYLFWVFLLGIPGLQVLALLWLKTANPAIVSLLLTHLLLAGLCLFFLKGIYRLDNTTLGFAWKANRFNAPLPTVILAVVPIVVLLGMGALHDYGARVPSSGVRGLIQSVSQRGSGAEVFGVVLLLGLVGPICEEIVFRGYLFNCFRWHTSGMVAVALSALAFALAHQIPVLLPYYFALGIILAVLYSKSRSILPCILTHSLLNLTLLTLSWLS